MDRKTVYSGPARDAGERESVKSASTVAGEGSEELDEKPV